MPDMFFDGTISQLYTSWQIMPVFEFAAIAFLVIITYLAIHNLYSSAHQLVKFSFAVVLGTLGYSFGKIVLVVMFVQPLLNVHL